MQLGQKQIIDLLVRTQSGQPLGHIKDMEIDSNNLQVSKFIVSPGAFIEKIFKENLVIDRSQVIEINQKEMVVEDSLVRGLATVKEPISVWKTPISRH